MPKIIKNFIIDLSDMEEDGGEREGGGGGGRGGGGGGGGGGEGGGGATGPTTSRKILMKGLSEIPSFSGTCTQPARPHVHISGVLR